MKLIYHPPLRHTSLGKYWDFVLYRRNFLKKVKCLNLEVSNFSKQLLFGQGVFCWKTIRRTIKSKQLDQVPFLRIITSGRDRLYYLPAENSRASRNATESSHNGYNWEMGKEKCFVVPQDCIQIVWGVETPCNGSYASLLCFDCLSSPKFRFKTSEKQWQILPR